MLSFMIHAQVSILAAAEAAYRDMGISGIPLGISRREDGVDEDKGPYDLSTQPYAVGVAVR